MHLLSLAGLGATILALPGFEDYKRHSDPDNFFVINCICVRRFMSWYVCICVNAIKKLFNAWMGPTRIRSRIHTRWRHHALPSHPVRHKESGDELRLFAGFSIFRVVLRKNYSGYRKTNYTNVFSRKNYLRKTRFDIFNFFKCRWNWPLITKNWGKSACECFR